MDNKARIQELGDSLEVQFTNSKLLLEAITHSSFAKPKASTKYNERLEFLGDAVLQLVMSNHLFELYEDKTEGELSKLRALIVCENSLHLVAKKWNLGKFIRMSKGEEYTGGRNRVSILADAVEAIIAAVYLDQGIEVAEKFILDNFKKIVKLASDGKLVVDYKSKLQEYYQQHGEVEIIYETVNFEGPPHRRKFFIKVIVNNDVFGEGVGYSKKEGEQKAARDLLIKLEAINEE